LAVKLVAFFPDFFEDAPQPNLGKVETPVMGETLNLFAFLGISVTDRLFVVERGLFNNRN
jgi:hypothetical protein